MQTFEIGHFWGVTGFGQRFETGLDQVRDPAAKYRLFAEQIGFALFLEIGFDDAAAATADA